MLLSFKKLFVHETNSTKEINAVQLWEVRWKSRYNEFFSGTQPEVEIFTDEQTARDFKQALEQAFRLLRHTSGTRVTLKKAA